jgi:hypothetical protein
MFLAIGLMAGCGSGGSTASTPMGTTSISGKVADGYLVGATVFMDKNGNYLLDAGEPSATTDQNGAYTLMNVDPNDVGVYPIVAMAIKGQTIDKDTGAAVTSSYVLSMPAADVSGTVSSNFISPMSSEVREMMETHTYTMQQAMDQLRTQLGLTAGTNMMADYMANQSNANYQAMHTAAQNMATLMGSQMAQVMAANGTSVDANRYRTMMGTIFSNMSSLTGTNAQTTMTNLMTTMTSGLANIPSGQPFRNMSTSFRGGMMGGTGTRTMTGGMM